MGQWKWHQIISHSAFWLSQMSHIHSEQWLSLTSLFECIVGQEWHNVVLSIISKFFNFYRQYTKYLNVFMNHVCCVLSIKLLIDNCPILFSPQQIRNGNYFKLFQEKHWFCFWPRSIHLNYFVCSWTLVVFCPHLECNNLSSTLI